MNQARIESTGASRASLKSYAIGFILSVALTVFAFVLVLSGALPRTVVLAGIFGAAVVQMLVHLHYFLHLDTSSTLRWNLMALIFAVSIIILFVGATIWIMLHLNSRLMP